MPPSSVREAGGPGSRVGPYEILAPLDVDRDVAVKALPQAVAADPHNPKVEGSNPSSATTIV